MRSLAHHVLLVDGDMKRLQHALTKLREDSAASRFFALNKVATPVGVDAGELDDILVEAFDGAVDIIKIDIDSYDCAVLLSMLLRVEAVAIVLESQPLVPPPFKFARAFRSDVSSTDRVLIVVPGAHVVAQLSSPRLLQDTVLTPKYCHFWSLFRQEPFSCSRKSSQL